MVLSSSMDFNSNSIEAVVRELAFFKVVRSDELFCQSTGQGFLAVNFVGMKKPFLGRPSTLKETPSFICSTVSSEPRSPAR